MKLQKWITWMVGKTQKDFPNYFYDKKQYMTEQTEENCQKRVYFYLNNIKFKNKSKTF